jgi:hypothetical protein
MDVEKGWKGELLAEGTIARVGIDGGSLEGWWMEVG